MLCLLDKYIYGHDQRERERDLLVSFKILKAKLRHLFHKNTTITVIFYCGFINIR